MKTNQYEKQEGILLHTISYLGRHRILKILTPDAGLISLFAKQVAFKRLGWATPFCKAEWVFERKQSDLFSLKDASLLDAFAPLRTQYNIIMAAGSIASDLISSQLPQKSCPALYALTAAYLQHVPHNPTALAHSFRLKLLQCEGLLHLQPTCAHCSLPASYLTGGESVCSHHAWPGALAFEANEWSLLLRLGLSRRFSDLETVSLEESLIEKMRKLFEERISH